MISLASEQKKTTSKVKWNGMAMAMAMCRVAREIAMQRILSEFGYSPFGMTGYHFGAAAYLSYDHLPNLIRELLMF